MPGRFSSSKPAPPPAPEGSAPIETWVSPTASDQLKQMILSGSAGLLLHANFAFAVVSNVTFLPTAGEGQTPAVCGILGDKLTDTNPAQLQLNEIFSSACVLSSANDFPAIHGVKSTHLATDTLAKRDSEADTVQFFDNASDANA